MKEILESKITILNLRKNISNKLLSNKIDNVLKVCNFSRMELIELGFFHDEINDIIISLQLLGLDLKKNHAKKNTLLDGYV